MLSQSAEYALRGVLHLARSEGDLIPSDSVADALGVPRNYLSKLLNGLAAAGILVSQRGPRGGFRLARPAGSITVGEVVGTYDPELMNEGARCLLGKLRCSDRDPCAAHERWKQIQEPLRRFLRNTTIDDLIRHPERALELER